MRILFLFAVIVLLLTNMIGFVGCSRDAGIPQDVLVPGPGEGWVVEKMPIHKLEILVSESRPAQVSIKVTTLFPNTCVPPYETQLEPKMQDGDTIYIQITWRIKVDDTEWQVCGQAITEVQEEFPLGTFAVGEYTLNVNGIEQVFRIE